MQLAEPQPTDAARAAHRLSASPAPAWQPIHLPTPVLRDVERHAQRAGQSISWCLRMAWSLADSLEIPSRTPKKLLTGRPQPVRVVMPTITWRAIALSAERLDRSRSWLLSRAWLAARPKMLDALRRR